MHRRVAATLVAILALGLVGCRRDLSDAAEVTDIALSPPVPITGVVGAEGRVVPQAFAHLSFATGGTVASVVVDEAEVVATGQPLVRLAAVDQEVALVQAEAAVLQATAALEAARTGLLSAQTNLDAAHLGKRAAEAHRAFLEAGASPAQLALQEAVVAAASAAVIQAAGERAYALEPASLARTRAAEANLAAAEAAIVAARVTYDSAPKDISDTQLSALQNELNAAIANRSAAQAALTELREGATASEQVAANSSVAAATYQRDAAAADLAVQRRGARQEELIVAAAQVAGAESAIAAAEEAVKQAQAAVSQAEANLAQAQAAREIAQDALDKRTLVSPIAGTVVHVGVVPGESLAAGVPAVTVADLGGWVIETTDLSEHQVVHIAPGDRVRVELDALPGAELDGLVREVAYAPQPVLGDVVYAVTVDLGAVALPVRWGMTAFVEVDTQEGRLPEAAAHGTQPPPRSSGEIVPPAAVDQAFELGGTVASILVAEGDTVRAGDVLARLDSREATLAVDRAQAQVVAAAEAIVAAQGERRQAELAVTRAQEDVTIARAQLNLLMAGPRPEEIEAMEARVAAAEAAVSQAIGQRDSSLRVGTPAQVAGAEARVAAAQADLIAMRERYDDIINGCFTRPDGVEVCPFYGPVEEMARAQLQATELNLAAAQAQLDQLASGATAGQQQAANGLVALAAANRDVARAQLDLLMEAPTSERIEQAEVAVAQAEMGVQLAELGAAQAGSAVAQAEALLAQSEAALEAARAGLDRRTLTAAMDGTVTAVNARVGEFARAGGPAVTVADLSGWMVQTTDFTELDVARAGVGQEVTVTVDALPDEALAGVITSIAQVAGLAQGDVVYEVTIALGETGALPLRWGMTTEVVIEPSAE